MLDVLFRPESIAVIGASRTPGKVGHEVLSNLVEGGFGGRLIPVNPSADEILGLKCCGTMAGCEGTVDLAVIALPAPLVADAVRDAIDAKTRAIVILSAGFGEAGSQGILVQAKIAQLCRDAGVRLLGPNCLGVINTSHRLNASFAKHMPKTGGVSVLSQSGALCTAVLEWAHAHDVGLAKVASIGNKADLDETELLKLFAADEETRIVVGYLETITRGDEFILAARALTSSKPFILLRAGGTRAGMWAASVHTGNLAGADIAYAAAFKRAGIIRAESLDSLFDHISAFARQPLPRGDRVAVITNAGGPAVMAADAVERVGLKLAKLDGEVVEKLRRELPATSSTYNPIDILGDADPQRYASVVEAAQQDESVDATIVILTPHAMTKPSETVRAIVERVNGDKPLLLVFLGQPNGERWSDYRLPVYSSPERAVTALHSMHEYWLWRHRPEYVLTRFPVNRRRVERIIMRHLRTNNRQIGEVEAKEVLRSYDFDVPDGAMANSPQEAVEIAERIGFPVAMKVVSPDILHKSDVGGVKLNVASAEDVHDTCDLLMLRIGRRAPGARVEGVYVEKMCGQGLQVVLGVTSDARFGPLLIFGLGGAFVDRLRGFSCHLAPITADEAMQMLSETRSSALLQGMAGHMDVDLSAIISGLQRISQLATDFPQVKELSIDPYLVGPKGTQARVVDARITLFPAENGR
jgi:acetyltransferase